MIVILELEDSTHVVAPPTPGKFADRPGLRRVVSVLSRIVGVRAVGMVFKRTGTIRVASESVQALRTPLGILVLVGRPMP